MCLLFNTKEIMKIPNCHQLEDEMETKLFWIHLFMSNIGETSQNSSEVTPRNLKTLNLN